MSRAHPLRATLCRLALIALMAMAAPVLGPVLTPVLAQGTGLRFDEIQNDESQPVEVASDMLEVDQNSGVARFTGNVVVSQGSLRLSAGVVEARYASGDVGQSGQSGQSGRLSALSASDKVTIAAGAAAITANAASYDMDAGQLVMTGDVVLTQDGNTLSGQNLTIDIKAGTGRMEGRVRTILQTRRSP